MKLILGSLVDFFFPKTCVVCNQVDTWLCKKCALRLELASGHCPHCRKPSLDGFTHPSCRKIWGLDGLSSLYKYKNLAVKQMVAAIKYDFLPDAITQVVQDSGLPHLDFDLITYIPLHRRRQNWRGFNQAEKLGEQLSHLTGMPLGSTLKRTKYTSPLVGTESAQERRQQMKNVFSLAQALKHKRVVLVDDVFTSGATMLEAAKVLKRKGAKTVWGWTLAST